MIFVIQKHYARKLHYDFRLEMNGVLKSWAVPKEIPLKEGIKRLAVEVEDHPLEYANFEGIIEEGYGKGKVEIWDKGNYELEKMNEKEISFYLNGEKVKGKYALIKISQKSYLLFKQKE